MKHVKIRFVIYFGTIGLEFQSKNCYFVSLILVKEDKYIPSIGLEIVKIKKDLISRSCRRFQPCGTLLTFSSLNLIEYKQKKVHL